MPMLADIQAMPPSSATATQTVLTFTFGGVATVPPPPPQPAAAPAAAAAPLMAAPNGDRDGGEIAVSADATVDGADGAAASEQHAFVATELVPPFRITSCNSRWSEISGYSEAAMLGQTLEMLCARFRQ